MTDSSLTIIDLAQAHVAAFIINRGLTGFHVTLALALSLWILAWLYLALSGWIEDFIRRGFHPKEW